MQTPIDADTLFDELGVPGALRVWADAYSSSAKVWQGLTIVAGPDAARCADFVYALLALQVRQDITVWVLDSASRYTLPTYQSSITQMAPQGIQETLDTIREATRYDPDLLAVIDPCTTEVATRLCEVSLTGHRVLATLEAGSGPEALRTLSLMAPELLGITFAHLIFIGHTFEALHTSPAVAAALSKHPPEIEDVSFEQVV